jgi:pimeloyl-ACP methyl ester carboxylesterase
MIGAFPRSFQIRNVKTDDVTIHLRGGGRGPAVVMLPGFGDTGDMWAPVAAVLVKDHLVVVPDLRGMGLSSHPEGGYDKKTQAHDIAAVMNKLRIEKAALVTHDIGNMVGYAFAAQFPERVTHWVVIDAPLPGIGPWEEIIRSPALWHFNFRGSDVERLVKGRERIYLDRFWNELSAKPKAINEATRRHYARLYARPRAMHSAFNQFAAFAQDAVDNKVFAANGKLTMPVLALGGDHSFGTTWIRSPRRLSKLNGRDRGGHGPGCCCRIPNRAPRGWHSRAARCVAANRDKVRRLRLCSALSSAKASGGNL